MLTPHALLDQIGRLLDDPDAQFAADTLEGIRATVEKTNYVTTRQAGAIQHIARVVERSKRRLEDYPTEQRSSRSRRYDGWGPSRE